MSTTSATDNSGDKAADAPAGQAPARRRALPELSGTAKTGLGILGGLSAAALIGPLLLATNGRTRVGRPFSRPSAAAWLGTDDVGRDLFAQLIIGSRASLAVALCVGGLATVLAAVVGGFAGIAPRWLASLLMRGADVVLTLPFLPLLIVAAAFLGQGFAIRVGLLAALTWAGPARVVRAGVLSAWSLGHLDAARAMGATNTHLLFRHASHVVAPLLVPIFVRTAMSAIVLDASLAFLGLGDPTTPSWGTMIHWASTTGALLTDTWLWWAVPPGLAITITVVGLGLVGIGVEERLNPALRGVR